MWNATDWQKVDFSDEFRFVLSTDDNRVHVMRRPGERYSSPYTVVRLTDRIVCVRVWRLTGYDSRPTLHCMNFPKRCALLSVTFLGFISFEQVAGNNGFRP